MIGIICVSPYQLICSINILAMDEMEKEVVLFLPRNRYDYSEIKEGMSIGNFTIKEIYYFYSTNGDPKYKINYIKKIIEYISMSEKSYLEKNTITRRSDETVTKIIFTRGLAYLASAIFHNFGDNNTKLYILEEGVGEYNLNLEKVGILKYLNISKNISGFYLTNPDKYPYSSRYPILKVPLLDSSKEETIKNQLNLFFKLDKKYDIKRTVYLSQPCEISAYQNREEQIFQIMDKYSHGDYCIKPHPRMICSPDKQHPIIEDKRPFECIALNQNTENSVFISVFSTAIVSPKVLYDKEPYIICLINLFKDVLVEREKENKLFSVYKKIVMNQTASTTENLIKYFYSVKKQYREPNKFIIPNTFDELIDALSKLYCQYK